MRALVMAAGLGTRLRPLTDQMPKPLVPVAGKPMISYVLELLARQGVREAIVNVHYLPGKMVEFVNTWNGAGRAPHLRIQDESGLILGSGGAVAKAAAWLFETESDALVCNADVIAQPDLRALEQEHKALKKQGVEATLLVMPHPEAGRKYTGLRVEEQRVVGFEKEAEPSGRLLHFPGFYMVSEEGAARLAAKPCSVVEDLWKPLAAEGKLGAFEYNGIYCDLGTVADLQEAERCLLEP